MSGNALENHQRTSLNFKSSDREGSTESLLEKEGGISFNRWLFAYVYRSADFFSGTKGQDSHWREIARQKSKSIHSGGSRGIWVSPESNRHKEWYLALDGCLLGQGLLATRACVMHHQGQDLKWVQTEVHLLYIRTVWWEDPSKEPLKKYVHELQVRGSIYVHAYTRPLGRSGSSQCRRLQMDLFYQRCLPQVPPPILRLPGLWHNTGRKKIRKRAVWKKLEKALPLFTTPQAKAQHWGSRGRVHDKLNGRSKFQTALTWAFSNTRITGN